jgi:post-segregation antitoxin (ccd killing protein)
MRRTFTGRTRRRNILITVALDAALAERAAEQGVSVSALVEDYCRRHVKVEGNNK